MTAVSSSMADGRGALRGIVCMVVAVALFTIMDSVIRWLALAGYPTFQLIFFRSLFAFLPLSLILFQPSFRDAVRMRDKKGHLIRCVVGLCSMGGFFWALKLMPLADVIAVSFAAPIFITALSVPLLGERVGIRRWSACILGFIGVLLIVQPGSQLFEGGALVALGGTVFYALAAISVRRLARTETNASIIVYFTLTCTLVSAAALPFPGQWVTPDWTDLGLLLALGLLGGSAQIFVTEAFRSAEVAVIIPFEYTALLWSTGIGYAVWSEIPGLNVWAGAAIVIASGLYIVWREARLGRRGAPVGPASV